MTRLRTSGEITDALGGEQPNACAAWLPQHPAKPAPQAKAANGSESEQPAFHLSEVKAW
jgi:hypothetical protein